MTLQANAASATPQFYPVNSHAAALPVYDHPQLGPVRYTVTELPRGADDQVAVTLGRMQARTKEDAQDLDFKARAAMLTGWPGASDTNRMENAYAHTKGVIQFQRDEVTGSGLGEDVVETIIRPVDMARYVDQGIAVGDCDDFSTYLACLLESVGIPCGFVTVAADGSAPDEFSHVYVVAYPMIDGQRVRVPLDASHGDYPGWEVPNKYGKIREWPVNGGVNWCLVSVAVSIALFAWPKVWPWVRSVFR